LISSFALETRLLAGGRQRMTRAPQTGTKYRAGSFDAQFLEPPSFLKVFSVAKLLQEKIVSSAETIHRTILVVVALCQSLGRELSSSVKSAFVLRFDSFELDLVGFELHSACDFGLVRS
jgi:hypothetical protein